MQVGYWPNKAGQCSFTAGPLVIRGWIPLYPRKSQPRERRTVRRLRQEVLLSFSKTHGIQAARERHRGGVAGQAAGFGLKMLGIPPRKEGIGNVG